MTHTWSGPQLAWGGVAGETRKAYSSAPYFRAKEPWTSSAMWPCPMLLFNSEQGFEIIILASVLESCHPFRWPRDRVWKSPNTKPTARRV
jgi:hypothetical protein